MKAARIRTALVLLATLIGLSGAAPAPAVAFHAGHSSCTYEAGTVRLVLASQHVVRLLAVDGRIEYADLTDFSHRGQCGIATVRNTDRVRLTETVARTTRLQFDQQLGRFGPGRTIESSGVSEIEVYLGTVRDVWLMGRAVRDEVVIGTRGLNFNGDGDVDLIGTSLIRVTAFLDDGDDSLSAAGGSGTGDPWLPTTWGYLSAYGGDGDDLMRGTRRGDSFDGDLGHDRLVGGPGPDDLNGGSGRDRIEGGGGNDVIDAGPWSDTVAAGAGDDHIRTADWTFDRVDGGTGTDQGIVDEEDAVTGVESVSIGP